ncbi:alpha/beta hydrolase [Exercitatus varius]|uniref:alpha/beta hydrolase n=1 Tax=Exercitatus varius TaxID=67857 RepID=UPI00294B07E7|nr:alpha/beta hydrolase [Exercitatus varius]MDG2943784.1 alpha/beta hydrolase [Exercitatus varius]MDG2959123.1 alpha/beta hydrolase [Exercitatus varius]
MYREPHFGKFALSRLAPFAEQFPVQYMDGQNGCRLAYRYFHHQAHCKLVILVNGRAENLLKWTEVAYDFYHRGYDVLAFDHRGQGFSQRLLQDKQKGYLDEFRFYVADMAKIIEKSTALFAYQSQHILAHSMGGLISAYYLADYDHRITNAVLSAPFFGMPLKHPIRDQLVIGLMLLLGQGERYVFGKQPYRPVHVSLNDLSSCATRMRWMNRVNRKHPELGLGGPTFRWVHLCLQAIRRLPQVLPKIDIPVLILQSEQEKIVANKNLENLTALLPQGKLEQIPLAKHEILFEKDAVRENALQKIWTFMENPLN